MQFTASKESHTMKKPANKPANKASLSTRTVAVAKKRQAAPLLTPTDLKAAATRDVGAAMNGILADVFALYLKTKNFHWHMSGPHFRDYHVMLDEQADQIYAMADPIAERIRKLGGTTFGTGWDILTDIFNPRMGHSCF